MIDKYCNWYCELDDNKFLDALLGVFLLPLCIPIMLYVIIFKN